MKTYEARIVFEAENLRDALKKIRKIKSFAVVEIKEGARNEIRKSNKRGCS